MHREPGQGKEHLGLIERKILYVFLYKKFRIFYIKNMIKCLPINLLNRLIAEGIIELRKGLYCYTFSFAGFLALSTGLRIISYSKNEILSLYRKDNNNFDFIQRKTELIKFKSEQAVYDYMVGIYHGFMKQYYEIINNETVKAINNLN